MRFIREQTIHCESEMNLAKPKKAPSKANTKGGESKIKGLPTLEDFLLRRDFTGALTLLEFKLKCQDGSTKELLLWIGYCAFHFGNSGLV